MFCGNSTRLIDDLYGLFRRRFDLVWRCAKCWHLALRRDISRSLREKAGNTLKSAWSSTVYEICRLVVPHDHDEFALVEHHTFLRPAIRLAIQDKHMAPSSAYHPTSDWFRGNLLLIAHSVLLILSVSCSCHLLPALFRCSLMSSGLHCAHKTDLTTCFVPAFSTINYLGATQN